MNDPVINITITRKEDTQGLPQIEVYQAKSGEYFFRDVEIITDAISSGLNRLDSMELASVSIAIKVLSISQRAR